MDKKRIGNLINKLRCEKNWTQEFLANKLVVDRTTISKWERGEYIPSIDTLIKIHFLFDISLDELFMEEELSEKIIHFSMQKPFEKFLGVNNISVYFIEKSKHIELINIKKINENDNHYYFTYNSSYNEFENLTEKSIYCEIDYIYKKEVIIINVEKHFLEEM